MGSTCERAQVDKCTAWCIPPNGLLALNGCSSACCETHALIQSLRQATDASRDLYGYNVDPAIGVYKELIEDKGFRMRVDGAL